MEPGSKSREQPMSKPPPTHPPQPHSHQPSHFPLHQPSYAYPTSAPYPSFPPPSSSSASYHTSHTLLAQSHPLPSSVQKLSPTIPTSTRQTSAPHLQSQPQPVALPPNPTRQVPAARHRNLTQQQSFSPAFNSSALNAPVSSSAQHVYASPPTSLLSRNVTPGHPQPALSKSISSHDPSSAGLQHSPVLNRQAAAQQPPQQNVFRNDNFFSTLPQRQKNLASRQPQQPSPQQQQHLQTQPPQHPSHNADIKVSNRNLPFPVDRLSPHAEPFQNSKSLPFPISHHPLPTSPAGLSPSNTRPPNPGPSSTALPVLSQRSTLPPTLAAASNVTQSHPSTRGLLYDISKLHAAQCTIIGGKVYNDKGHSICGVLNQHDKPCKRIGKCPFHGVSQPVSAQNSCHGYVDELGTAPAPANDDNGLPGSGNASGDPNSTGVSVTSNPDTGPKGIPKKQQYKHGWSKEEHYLFLRGLQMHDRGSWKQISNVVQSRNATQVQSHAQKYFLRQKQNNKNKRSIHDLTMDSPEMQELEKRYRNGDFRSVVPPVGLSEGLYDPSTGDGGAGRVRDDHAAGLGQGISGANQGITAFAQSNTVGHNMMADGNLPRFGQAGGVAMPRLGQGQPVSATTLGSSVSSGVHIPQLQGGHQARGAFQGTAGFMQTHDLLGHTGNAAQKKFNNMKTMRPRSDIPQGRDAFHSGSRPNFGQEVYQSTLTPTQSGINSMMTVGHGFSPKTEQKTLDPALLQPGIDRSGETQNDHGPNQQMYTQNGFPGLYGQSGGNNLFHQGQSRPSGENQLAWPYDSDGKSRRPREMGGRESISFQNSFSGMASDGFGQVSNIPVMSSDNHVVTGFEGPGNHGASFQTALFGSPDAVEVGDNPNSYSINGQPQAGVSINGFAAPAGLQLNGLSVRGQGNVPNTFVRN